MNTPLVLSKQILHTDTPFINAGLHSQRARGPGFDTWSSHILSFSLPLIQEGQLSVTGRSMCT